MNDEHRWKLSWPGNYCLDCGIGDPFECNGDKDVLLDCPDCTGPTDPPCATCAGTGAVVNKDIVVPPCLFKEDEP